jgi:peroxiredoxin 2/4
VPSILQRAADFKAPAVSGTGEATEVSLSACRGRWVVLFFYPRDFTVVCPTEILELSKRLREFREVGAEVIALSVDTVERHRQWIAEKLGRIEIPLAADPSKAIARSYGVLLEEQGVAARATFVIDPSGVVRYAAFHDLAVGRSISEILRVLEALQAGAPVPAEWRPGDRTLEG